MKPKTILFVCIGNTCRSPMAECIMNYLIVINHLNWEVDSAALRAWNVGRRPDKRCLRVLQEHGLKSRHVARVMTIEDFTNYDYILAMDRKVLQELKNWASYAGNQTHQHIELLGSYLNVTSNHEIKDPFSNYNMKAFRNTFNHIKNCCVAFISKQELQVLRAEVLYDSSSSDEDESFYDRLEQEEPETEDDSSELTSTEIQYRPADEFGKLKRTTKPQDSRALIENALAYDFDQADAGSDREEVEIVENVENLQVA